MSTFPDSSDLKAYEQLVELYEEALGELHKKAPCLMCGSDTREETQVCKNCLKELKSFSLQQALKEVIQSRPAEVTTMFCKVCFRHFKACSCPSGVALRSLKEE